MSEKDKIYFTTTDPEGRTIHLQKQTWDHIKERHPEIKRPHEVKATIQNPDIITENTQKKQLGYTKIARMDLHINVYARMADDYKEGKVKTSFLSRKPPRGEVIWVKKS